jgi:hypothetical protein
LRALVRGVSAGGEGERSLRANILQPPLLP